MNYLKQEVKEIINKHIEDYEEPSEFFSDLQQGGCASGLIGELVYYSDTVAFYERHNEDINELLHSTLEDTGLSCPSELFGDNWDKEDPLALDTLNRNLLAWFAFEDIAFRLEDEIIEEAEEEDEDE